MRTRLGLVGLLAAALAAILLPIQATSGEAAAPTVLLASEGEARLPIVVGTDAEEDIREAARSLADTLERISGAEFALQEGDGASGIVVGRPSQFPALPFPAGLKRGPFHRDDYRLRSTRDGLYLLGSTPPAVHFAVWDLLARLGYRYYFASDNWEIVPELETVAISADEIQHPDFYSRRAPRGAPIKPHQPWAHEGWRRWVVRNRLGSIRPTRHGKPGVQIESSFSLRTGHVYQALIRRHQDAFRTHREWYGLHDGNRQSTKLCIGNPAVRDFVADYAVDYFRDNPDEDTISLEPSDGGRWCECDRCAALGSISDRVVTLANAAAEALDQAYGDKYVGILAYNFHSPPPSVPVHPNVIVCVATWGGSGGYTVDQLIDGWQRQMTSPLLGIYEYYAVVAWDKFLPARARSADLNYLSNSIARYHRSGARFMNAESDWSWGANGLGYYLSSRMLWDVENTGSKEELVEDFLTNCFGPAAQCMRTFYELLDASSGDPHVPSRRRPLNDDMVHRMYRSLKQARELARGHPDVAARIEDLILYTRFVDLYRVVRGAKKEKQQEALDTFLRFAWTIRSTVMAPSVNLIVQHRRFVDKKGLSWPEGFTDLKGPEDGVNCRDQLPFTDADFASFLAEGLERNELLELEFDPATCDIATLRPAGFPPVEPALKATPPKVRAGNLETLHLYLWTKTGVLPSFWLSAGHKYDNKGPLRWELLDAGGVPIRHGEILPGPTRRSGKRPLDNWREQELTRNVDLRAPEPGIYELVLSNGVVGYHWDYELRGAKLSMRADAEEPLAKAGIQRFYFYVPKGKEKVVVAGTIRGRHRWLPGPGWDEALSSEQVQVDQGYTVLTVPEGADGTVWMYHSRHSRRAWPTLRFLNVPGFLAHGPSELLLPEKYVREIRQSEQQ